jgi:hypothetical protein
MPVLWRRKMNILSVSDQVRNFNTYGRKTHKVEFQTEYDDYGMTFDVARYVPTDLAESTVISSSLLGSDKHMPALDLDVPVRVYPSTTLGHFHLYIDKEMTWWQYKRLMRAMVAAGILEKGYYKASTRRSGTHLRLPWIKKDI